ncbi:MAG: zinc ribbon domain-containing protein [Mycobacterium sp.]
MTGNGDPVPEPTCTACGTSGPPGSYCTSCGSRFGYRGRRGHPVAPGERVFLPSVVTSLFPRLTPHARGPFRIALVAVLGALVAFAVLRWQAPVVVVATFGFALLFTMYLAESDVFHDFPRQILASTAILGVVIGAVWGAFSGKMVARGYDVPLGSGPDSANIFAQGMALTAAGALVMLLPTVVVAAVWARGAGQRESLDGYVIGASGATFFTVASTVVRLTPQLAAGPTTVRRSTMDLLVGAGIHGFAVPLTAAALGGLFGLALWFRRASGGGVEVRAVAAAVLVIVVLSGVQRVLEILPVREWIHLVMHLGIAVITLSVNRFGVRWALLKEALDPTEHAACPDCGPAEPGARFCADCGVALHAFSRTARSAGGTGRSVPATRRRLALAVGAGVGVLAVVAFAVSTMMTARPARYVCPPDCGAPPIGTPVETNPQFTSTDGDFTVSYPGRGTAYRSTFTGSGVVLDFTGGDTGTLELHGEPAGGRSPQQVITDLLRRRYPDAAVAYEIPNASVGYQPGYGVAADDYPQDGSGTYMRLRILVLAAVKNDYALVASAVGPYHEFSPSFGNGHPSGANLQLALDMAKYVNSFVWRGDSPR